MLSAVIDISHHNTVSSFASARAAGVLGRIRKATQGASYTAPEFAGNRQRAAAAGLLFGAYHFGTAGDASARAEHLLAVAGKGALGQDVFIDRV